MHIRCMSSALPNLLALYRRSPVLIRCAATNIALLVIALIGLAIDHRVVTDAPAWLKPAKFSVSVSVFLVFVAWMVYELPATAGLKRATALISWILTVEVVLITVQAARGTTSHFNVDTPLDAAVFSSMGIGIAITWLSTMFILWTHWRTPSTDRAMALAFRLGLALNILGAGVGWRMTAPSADQVQAIQRGVRPRVAGAHTVGGKDGGPGLLLTHWSTLHGDLRVSHFVGMHALQLLPLLLLGVRAMRRRDNDSVERSVLLGAATLCALAFVATLLQALRGLPLLALPGG